MKRILSLCLVLSFILALPVTSFGDGDKDAATSTSPEKITLEIPYPDNFGAVDTQGIEEFTKRYNDTHIPHE